jgi:hypothetical protein
LPRRLSTTVSVSAPRGGRPSNHSHGCASGALRSINRWTPPAAACRPLSRDRGRRIFGLAGLPPPRPQVRIAELVQSGCDLGRELYSGRCSSACDQPDEPPLRCMTDEVVGTAQGVLCFDDRAGCGDDPRVHQEPGDGGHRAGKARERRIRDESVKPLKEVQPVKLRPGQSLSGQAGSECCLSPGNWRVRSVHSKEAGREDFSSEIVCHRDADAVV